MKKKLVGMLLALVIAASVCSAAFATSEDIAPDTAMLEKIAAQEAARAAQEIPSMIEALLQANEQKSIVCETIWYDEAGRQIEDPDLLEQLEKGEQTQMICQTILYDEAGNQIENLELIGKLCAGAATENIACCDDPSFETYYREQHFYESPKPALCTCYRSEISVCRNCATLISHMPAAERPHMHE